MALPNRFTISDNITYIVNSIGYRLNDKTKNYWHTYNKIYAQINSSRGWQTLRTRRHCITNKELIENDMKLKKRFIDISNEIMKGIIQNGKN